MKILITGSSGFVGKAVVKQLARNHELFFFSHSDSFSQIPQVDAIIHLAGENIFGRWTKKKKRRIRESRLSFTEKLVASLVAQDKTPKHFLSASAIGFYGDRGDEILDENSAKGEGFLSDVCEGWENASKPLIEKGTRVVHMRFGVILSPDGGALKKMLLPFKLGLGGRIGTGKQWMSVIQLTDLLRAIEFLLEHREVTGAVNLCTPIINLEFSKQVAKSVNRSLGPPLPAFFVKLLFGEMGESLLLASTRVQPNKILTNGFSFIK
ncbi:MAG: hypothetical protein ChlgKO_09740 [Chlamydiales bacterium]